ncbi:restriction endonuclease subunit S [Bacillus sp. Hm123]|uniref:restriction endonuclease subunit S n=1 Tax=Bacillus sp. Hm123 TaxID=3450745 RepID=UPI003F435F02
MSKKKKTIEELLEEALVLEEEQPYEVPENWMWVKIKGVGNVKGGKRLPKGHALLQESTDHPYLRVADFENGTIDNSDLKYISADTASKISRYVISKDDVYISIAGTIGKTGIVPDYLSGANLTENAAKITDIKGANNKFIHLVLNTDALQNQIKNSTVSTSQPKLALFRIDELKIPLPPLNEQKRIAEKVEQLLSKVEEAKRLIDEAKETFELRRKSILRKALNGELTKKWRENELDSMSAYEHIQNAYIELTKIYEEQCLSAKKENKPKPKRPEIFKHFSLKDNKIEGLSKWVKTTFIHLCVLQRGYDLPVQNRVGGSYPIVSAGGIIDHHNESKVKGPGVTTGRSGTIGSVFYIEEDYWPLNTSLYVDYFNGNNPKYVYYYLLNFDFQSYSSSTAVPTLNRNNFFQVEVKIPPKDEQGIIVEMLDVFFDKEAKSFRLIKKLEEKLETLKQSILSKAFRGELGTNDPSEETALELLKQVLQEQVK